ncbi:hypothetical protein ONV78_26290 [Hahella sp. CR1]|uniref:hypothetical protein n=1 Tax=Hahella sp. CR1 TaxID=2992807 RepID=UPI0024437187|nr:hypothetical protein [Hahella sp. CR1]MDG9671271.1 hypothetical protein [Hahella sp. CR1]
MSTDIKVLLEHLISDEWVLVDVDPIYSSDRNSKRREALYELKHAELPSNVSKGAKYWFEGDDALDFVAALSILDACALWHRTELNSNQLEMNLQGQLTTYFGLWEPDFERWRVIVAI